MAFGGHPFSGTDRGESTDNRHLFSVTLRLDLQHGVTVLFVEVRHPLDQAGEAFGLGCAGLGFQPGDSVRRSPAWQGSLRDRGARSAERGSSNFPPSTLAAVAVDLHPSLERFKMRSPQGDTTPTRPNHVLVPTNSSRLAQRGP